MSNSIDLDNINIKCKIDKRDNTITMSIDEFSKLYKMTDYYRNSNKNNLSQKSNDEIVYKSFDDFNDQQYVA